jgi:hypothetical protein
LKKKRRQGDFPGDALWAATEARRAPIGHPHLTDITEPLTKSAPTMFLTGAGFPNVFVITINA